MNKKFKVGSKVYYPNYDEVVEARIEKIHPSMINAGQVIYTITWPPTGCAAASEDEVFATAEEAKKRLKTLP